MLPACHRTRLAGGTAASLAIAKLTHPRLASEAVCFSDSDVFRKVVAQLGYKMLRHSEDDAAVEKLYQSGQKLGAGSFGVVYEGTCLKTHKKWAIKIINKEKVRTNKFSDFIICLVINFFFVNVF